MPAAAAVAPNLPAKPPASLEKPARRPAPRRPIFWTLLLLILFGAGTLVFYPPAWHVAVRAWLGGQAAARGLRLEIDSIEGSLLAATVLHGVRVTEDGAAPASSKQPTTDLRINRAELVFTAPLSRLGRGPANAAPPSWLGQLVLEGVHGNLALDLVRGRPHDAAPAHAGWLAQWNQRLQARLARFFAPLGPRLIPMNIEIVIPTDDDLQLHLRRSSLRLRGLRFTAHRDREPGVLLVREVEARGPGGLDSVYHDWHAATRWNGTRLSLNGLALAPGIELTSLTLDGAQLHRRRLDGDFALRALGGTLRAQAKVNLPRDIAPWQLELAGSVEAIAVRPLVELLHLAGPTGGSVRAGVFSFSGDPANLSGAAASLRFEATDFQWGARRWQRLLLAATVLNHRVTMHELDLVQRSNRLVFNGEGPLPPSVAAVTLPPPAPAADGKTPTAAATATTTTTPASLVPAWLDNFSCNLDARIDDLEEFAYLLPPGLPELRGRTVAQGTLTGRGRTLDGYLRVNAGPLRVRGAPLDQLRATLLFRGDELQITSLEAARAADTFQGKGNFQLSGSRRYAAEGHASVRDLVPYGPALTGLGVVGPAVGALDLEWSGDGAPGAHSGAFKVRLGGFQARGDKLAIPRRIDLESEGTYSPDSVSFRQLTLRDPGETIANSNPSAPARRGNNNNNGGNRPAPPQPATATAAPTLRLEGVSLPLVQDQTAEPHCFHPDGTLIGRVVWTDCALDLLSPLLPGIWREPATGRLTGWLDLAGTPRVPRLNGQLALRKARLRWADPRLGVWLDWDNVTADARLDGPGAALHLDKFAAERPDGGNVAVTGRVDWPESAAPPVFDLTLQAREVEVLNDANAHANGDLDVRVQGAGVAAEIAGKVRLHDAHVFRHFVLVPLAAPSPAVAFELTLAPERDNDASSSAPALAATADATTIKADTDALLASLLPLPSLASGPLAQCALDLFVNADAPLPMEWDGRVRGQLEPELSLSGSGVQPALSGRIIFRHQANNGIDAALLNNPDAVRPVSDGQLYLDAVEPQRSTVWLTNLPQAVRRPPRRGEAAPDATGSEHLPSDVFTNVNDVPLVVDFLPPQIVTPPGSDAELALANAERPAGILLDGGNWVLEQDSTAGDTPRPVIQHYRLELR
ncbi:MAG: translocation/assembly module TamB domain-containing protein [Verrucomicrobia bacterium]|nr:translocation/assembly module TamB domain-containing protein [Verrucomicrobiota bacterium]